MTTYTFKCFSIAKVHDNYEHLYIYYQAIRIYIKQSWQIWNNSAVLFYEANEDKKYRHTNTYPHETYKLSSTDYTEPYEHWHKNFQQNSCKLFYKISIQEQVQGWFDVWKQGSANTINKETEEKPEWRALETQRFLKYWHLRAA